MTEQLGGARYPKDIHTAGPTTGKRDGELRRIVNEAATVSKMTFAILSVVNQERRWVASASGMVSENGNVLDPFLARLTMRPGEILIIRDVLTDKQFLQRKHGSPTFRSFVGIPMVNLGGYLVGSLRMAGTTPLGKNINIAALSGLAREAERVLAR